MQEKQQLINFSEAMMNFDSIQQKTGYLLANPSQFCGISFAQDLNSLAHSELQFLDATLSYIAQHELNARNWREIKYTEWAQQVNYFCHKCGLSGIAFSSHLSSSSQLIPSNVAWKIGEILDSATGIPSASCMVSSAFVASFVLNLSEVDLKDYAKTAYKVAAKMHSFIRKNQIERLEESAKKTLDFFNNQQDASAISHNQPRTNRAIPSQLANSFNQHCSIK